MASLRGASLRTLHKLHLWVGVFVGIQLLLWTASGLFMTSSAIEEVRGTTLRRETTPVDLRAIGPVLPPGAALSAEAPVERTELLMLLDRPAYRLSNENGSWLVDARTGKPWPIAAAEALAIAGREVRLVPPLGVAPVSDPPPLELRRPGGAWLITDANDTHVYIGTAGDVLAVRTPLWRWFDFAWGLHILDPVVREDTHHPFLIASAALSLASVLTGLVLIYVRFRPRRRSRA